MIDVTDDGRAIVHASAERIEVLLQRTETLNQLSIRDRTRWATLKRFEQIPIELRIDGRWLVEIESSKELVDTVIELQPLLTRVEIEDVLRGLTSTLAAEGGSLLTGTGQDYSGRSWFRGKLSPKAIQQIANEFFSVQSIHDPLYSVVAARQRSGQGPAQPTGEPRFDPDRDSINDLPTVALLDTGVAPNHPRLSPYQRGTPLISPNATGRGAHATYVASRIVFGDVTWNEIQGEHLVPRCQFLSAKVSEYPDRINDKSILPMLETLRAAYPDVRVYNLSFSNRVSLADTGEVKRREYMQLTRDLDNFIFANDVVVVASSGNSVPGMQPSTAYPDHIDDPGWKMNSWVAGFNVLVCGAFVNALHVDGLVTETGWPSPFTRIGPGIAESPKPDFSAPGGNWDSTFNFRHGMGVLAMNPEGMWEDQSGTSLAAPIVARESAKVLHYLSRNSCPMGSRPFAVTVRAFLTLTAVRPDNHERVKRLGDRTLGYGAIDANRLARPRPESVAMVWQGEINGPKDLVRVNVPIPRAWLTQSENPRIRVVVCWDPPVNNAISGVWACRKVSITLRPEPDTKAVHPQRGPSHPSNPVIDRTYRLDKVRHELGFHGDMWLIDLFYNEIAEYFSGMDFTPSQRVGVALELFDDTTGTPTSPQSFIQSLPIAATMTHLSSVRSPVRQPVIVRSTAQ